MPKAHRDIMYVPHIGLMGQIRNGAGVPHVLLPNIFPELRGALESIGGKTWFLILGDFSNHAETALSVSPVKCLELSCQGRKYLKKLFI